MGVDLPGHLAASHCLRYVIRSRHWLDSSPGLLAAKLFGTCLVLAFAANIVIAPFPVMLGLNSLTEQFGMFRYFVPYSFFLFALWSLHLRGLPILLPLPR